MVKRCCVFFLLFTACVNPSSRTGLVKDGPVAGDDLIIGIFHQPSVINPLTTDSTISANLLDLTFDTVVQVNSKKEIIPHLAERWEITEDGKLWTFYLRKGVLFHDGKELTAEDVKFTFETLSKIQKQGYRYFFSYVKAFEAPSRYVFQIRLDHFDNALWGGMTVVNIVPKHLLDPETVPFNRQPIGTGPFKFISQDNKEIVFLANEKYFLGRPFLNHVKVEVFPSQRSNLTHLVSGEVDLLFLVGEDDYNIVAQIPEIKIYRNWSRILHLLFVNTKREDFHSSKIRRALSLALDRQGMISDSQDKKSEEAVGPFYQEGTTTSQEKIYNPQKALKILEEAGWKYSEKENVLQKNGRPFTFTVISVQGEELYEKILNKVQTQLLSLGIRVRAKWLPASEFFETLFKKRDFDMALYRYIDHPYFFTYYNFWHSSQIGEGLNFSYSNSLVDAALDKIRLEKDEKNRTEAYRDLQKTFQEDPPAIFLFWRTLPIAVHQRFRGIPEDHMDSFKEFRKVWVPKAEQKYPD